MKNITPPGPSAMIGGWSIITFVIGILLWIWIGDIGLKVALTAGVFVLLCLAWDLSNG